MCRNRSTEQAGNRHGTRDDDRALVAKPVGNRGRRRQHEEPQKPADAQHESDDGDGRAQALDPERPHAEIGPKRRFQKEQPPEDRHNRLWQIET